MEPNNLLAAIDAEADRQNLTVIREALDELLNSSLNMTFLGESIAILRKSFLRNLPSTCDYRKVHAKIRNHEKKLSTRTHDDFQDGPLAHLYDSPFAARSYESSWREKVKSALRKRQAQLKGLTGCGACLSCYVCHYSESHFFKEILPKIIARQAEGLKQTAEISNTQYREEMRQFIHDFLSQRLS